MPSNTKEEKARDKARADARQEELDRQKAVSDALEAHEKEALKEAKLRLEDPGRAAEQEKERLAEIDDLLNAATRAHDENAARRAEAERKLTGITKVEGKP